MTAVPPSGTTADRSVPGQRVFVSGRFRLLLAASLAVIGLVVTALLVTSMWAMDMAFLSDFEAYYEASRRWLQGQPMYSASQAQGPVAAWCVGCYLYPPPLAQALAPVALMPLAAAKVVWFVGTTLAAILSTWVATSIGGAARTLESLLWSVTAALLFFPVFLANSAGNVGSLLALFATMVALGGVAAGVGATCGMLLKVVPAAYVPAVLAAPGGARRSFLVTFLVVGGLSFVLAPASWLDYPAVFLNMTAGSAFYEANMALDNVARQAGFSETLVNLARLLSLAIAGAALMLSVWLARRPGGMPAAALLASVTMLMVPGTFWPHYLTVLLPFAAMAWPRTGTVGRIAMLGASSLLYLCAAGGYLEGYVGGTTIVVISAWVLWPRTSA